MPDLLLLTAFIDSSIQDSTIDALLAEQAVQGFSFIPVQGFSRDHATFDKAEQVAGFRQLFKLEIMHAPEQTKTLLDCLATLNTKQPMHYWLTPVLAKGTVGES